MPKPVIFHVYYCSKVAVDGKIKESALFAFPGESPEQAAEAVGWQIIEGNEIEGNTPGDFNQINLFLRCLLSPVLGKMKKAKTLRIKINLHQTEVANMRRKQ